MRLDERGRGRLVRHGVRRGDAGAARVEARAAPPGRSPRRARRGSRGPRGCSGRRGSPSGRRRRRPSACAPARRGRRRCRANGRRPPASGARRRCRRSRRPGCPAACAAIIVAETVVAAQPPLAIATARDGRAAFMTRAALRGRERLQRASVQAHAEAGRRGPRRSPGPRPTRGPPPRTRWRPRGWRDRPARG